MKSANVVIGANFGDEGKGLITDFLSAPYGHDALVVRFNGGAQASHTVVTADGRRHAFSHFSSGTFAGAATFLSRFYVCNPLLFFREYHVIKEKTAIPEVYVDSAAAVTTPYDMIINQIVEESRGHARHGSCGLGFGETIERNLNPQYALHYADLSDRPILKQKLHAIQQKWVLPRLKTLGIAEVPQEWHDRIMSEGVLEKYLSDVEFFLQMTQTASAGFLEDTKHQIIFEGAQGLLLDQNHTWFPHVTRSYTGLRNVAALAKDAGLDHLRVNYITRAYMTRHGAGPLPHELGALPYPRIVDETNILNAYQGALRFGWLDVDLLAATIKHDLDRHVSDIHLEYGLAVTCMDQVDGDFNFIKGGISQKTTQDGFLSSLETAINPQFMITSHGPSRNFVTPA